MVETGPQAFGRKTSFLGQGVRSLVVSIVGMLVTVSSCLSQVPNKKGDIYDPDLHSISPRVGVHQHVITCTEQRGHRFRQRTGATVV